MCRRSSRFMAESLEQRLALTSFFVESGGSIQDAIDLAASSPGPDTVLISSGEYEENLTIDDADKLTIRGMGDVTVTASDAEETSLRSSVLTGASASGVSMSRGEIEGSTPTTIAA